MCVSELNNLSFSLTARAQTTPAQQQQVLMNQTFELEPDLFFSQPKGLLKPQLFIMQVLAT